MELDELQERVMLLRAATSETSLYSALVDIASTYDIRSVTTQVLLSHPDDIPCIRVEVVFTSDFSMQTVVINPAHDDVVERIVGAITFLGKRRLALAGL